MPNAPDAVIIMQYGRLQAALCRLAGVSQAASVAARAAWDGIEELDRPRPNGQPPEYDWAVLGPICEGAEKQAEAVEKMALQVIAMHDAIISGASDLAYAALRRRPVPSHP